MRHIVILIAAIMLAISIGPSARADARSDLCDSYRIGTTAYRGVQTAFPGVLEAFGMNIDLISVLSRKICGPGVSAATFRAIPDKCSSAKGWLSGLEQWAETGPELGLKESIIEDFERAARYGRKAVDQLCG